MTEVFNYPSASLGGGGGGGGFSSARVYDTDKAFCVGR